jgi:hypothetical protein
VADTTVQAGNAARSHLTGRVVRGRGTAYRLTVGHRTTQVVRSRHATYVRKAPGPWSRLAHPHAIVNPTATLLGVLRRMVPTGRTGARTIVGQLSPSAARQVKLPHGGPAQVLVRLDRAGHVMGLLVRAQARAGTQTVGVLVRTSYTNFGQVAPIRRPV